MQDFTLRRMEPADEPMLLSLLERFVTAEGAARRFEWIYHQNPQGRANTWLATHCDQVLGFTSIFAREFMVDGDRVMGGVGFDAFVPPPYRRRGIALALHRACRAAIIQREVPFRFMCGPPVRANLDALVKAGAQVVGGLRYVGLPLTARGILEMLHLRSEHVKTLGGKLRILDGLFAAARAVLHFASRHIRVRPVEVTGAFDRTFDHLWDRLAPGFRVIGRRDAEYLRWRYVANPVCQQRLVALEDRQRLIGWAALEFSEKGCLLVDYLFPLDPERAQHALGALIAYVARRGACRLTLRFNLKGPYAALFLRHGFLPGWSEERVQILTGNDAFVTALLETSGWHFTSGDINPEASPWSVNSRPKVGVS